MNTIKRVPVLVRVVRNAIKSRKHSIYATKFIIDYGIKANCDRKHKKHIKQVTQEIQELEDHLKELKK